MQDGWQEVTLTSAVPLDMLFVYCGRKLDMKTDSAAVLSICSSQATNQDLLATVRCQAGTKRLWVHMRYNASTIMRISELVKVLIYALPVGAPRVARLLIVRLPALPYYSQHESHDVGNEQRSWSQMSITGSFSVAEMTSWLTEILPGDLPRPSTNIIFARSHTLLKTILICQYRRGSAVFTTDNISTIAVIRDIVTNFSLAKSIKVEIIYDIPNDCCLKSFIRLQEYFEEEHKKYKDQLLKNALRTLDLDDKDINKEEPTICEDYRRVWNIVEEDTKTSFHELVENLKQWYADWQDLSLHLKDYNNKKYILQNALQNCQLDQIKEIFENKPIVKN
ncbi:unnamed protein product [Diatraea saccharalis]|uniref:Uncharacterized protein n=1 Tax=Diatraea saccharalis TaxID=40085 RepID=A0A9N9WGK9_9NEOP|nr:unnamed protein product [Diatraea saccharalis]